MVIVEKPSWLKILFFVRGTALKRIWLRVAFVTLVATVMTGLEAYFNLFNQEVHGLTPLPFQLVGLALGIFLGFRNNTSYDRFWEGRKLWGRCVNTSRSITRQILTLIGRLPPGTSDAPVDASETEVRALQEQLVRQVAAYVHAFRMHLRNEDDLESLKRLMPADEVESLKDETNRPIAILQILGNKFRKAWDQGLVHSMHLPVLEASLTEFANIQGGCERIRATPIPFSYTALIHRIVALYCFGLPFGLVETTELYTPVVVMIISYAFFGLDAVGDEIEDPFGKDPNDLPLTSISTMIERNIRQRIGDTDTPEQPRPVANILQ